MSSRGFNNAPEITALASGMVVEDYRRRWQIVHVCPTGEALAIAVGGKTPYVYCWFAADVNLQSMTLDFSVPWVGRKYMGEPRVGGIEAIVRVVSDEYVVWIEHGMVLLADSRKGFLKNFKPLRLDPPAEKMPPLPDLCHPCVPARTCDPECPERAKQEEQQSPEPLPLEPPVGPPRTRETCSTNDCHWQGNASLPCTDYEPKVPAERPEPWKPTPGDECLYLQRGGIRVVPRYVMASRSWVVESADFGKDAVAGYIVATCDLRPLPPEPPVTDTGPIFSGSQSVEMWDKINKATTVDDLRYALYAVCCKLQQLESKLVPAAGKEAQR